MTKNKRTLAGFNQVANINVNNNDNENNIIGDILEVTKKKPILTGIYLEPDLAAALDEISKGKKGAKSKIVNAAVRKLMEEEGIIKS